MSQLYFAYGSNLNLKDLREFEKRNGINAKKSFVQLKYDILKTYIDIKYILGELPKNEEELNDFTLTKILY